MTSSHNVALAEESALVKLQRFMAERRAAKPVEDFERFERELHSLCGDVEREIASEELARLDMDVPMIMVDGVPHRRVVQCADTYFGAAGELRVTRTLYSTRGECERAVSPMELRAGIVEGRWTPLAAKQAMWVVAQMTPQEGEDLFKMLGSMTPSKSSLDRLPKQMSQWWELDRKRYEEELRAQEPLPERAATVAVSLDGVLVPMKDGARQAKRDESLAQGKEQRGPAGYQEVGCGTVSFYDSHGERLATKRLGRMPEHKKATLKVMLREELLAALAQSPELQVVAVADGAKDNWTFLGRELLEGVEGVNLIEVVDFYHAAEQLHGALQAAYGEGSPACAAQFEKLRHILREEIQGVEKVIRALEHLQHRRRGRKKIVQVRKFCCNNRHRMQYATWAAAGLPIGSGVVEAACKTLATQRMKRSGMRWRHDGGQAILTFRGFVQSDRFDRAWKLLAARYKSAITLPKNVVAFGKTRAR